MTTLLLDGDMFAHRQAAAEEKPLEFGEVSILSADAENGKANLAEQIRGLKERLGADEVIVTLSDDANFRKAILPTYKSNRKGVRKPIILGPLKRFLAEEYRTFVRPTLEADDVLGILATNPKVIPGEKIVVTWDKDLRSVPGLHWNPDKEGSTPTGKPTRISEAQADRAHMIQTLSGDIVDGYPGCPGIGTKRAAEIVDDPYLLTETFEEIKRGPNAGKKRSRWLSTPTSDLWAAVVSNYVKAGLTEDDALTFARVARILRHGDYDYKKKEPILWTPS